MVAPIWWIESVQFLARLSANIGMLAAEHLFVVNENISVCEIVDNGTFWLLLICTQLFCMHLILWLRVVITLNFVIYCILWNIFTAVFTGKMRTWDAEDERKRAYWGTQHVQRQGTVSLIYGSWSSQGFEDNVCWNVGFDPHFLIVSACYYSYVTA